MKTTITFAGPKITLALAIFSLIFYSCLGPSPKESTAVVVTQTQGAAQAAKKLPLIQLATSGGRLLQVYVAKSAEEQGQGLSGIKDEEFYSHEGMLFYYEVDGPHSFWMPDTYFALDIFFLDEKLKIIDVERNVPPHPGRVVPPAIATTRAISSRHVLELKSSDISQGLKVGDSLTLQSGTL